MKLWRLGLALFFALVAWGAHAQETGGGFDPYHTLLDAGRAFDEKRYEQAISLYRTLLGQGHDSADIYYNLGNALYRHGQLGAALAAYRSAERRAPRDGDIQANAALVGEQVLDRFEPSETAKVLRGIFFLYRDFSAAELLIAFLVLHALCWLGALLRRLRPSEAASWLLYLSLAGALVFGGLSSLKFWQERPGLQAVVAKAEVTVQSGKHGTVLFALHEGAEVEVEDRDGTWAKISLPDGKLGWVEQEHLAFIE